MRVPTIVAIGGGGFLQDADWVPEQSLEDWIALVAMPKGRARRHNDRVRVCYLGQAGGESDVEALWFFQAFSTLPTPCFPSVLNLFSRKVVDIRSFLLSQHLIYVGGGNTASLLAIWRTHGVDQILRECWQGGVVLAGMSAGANCWFERSTTDSFGQALQPLHDGLGFLNGSCCPHYDGEHQRRPVFQQLIGEAAFPTGLAIDDHTGVVFRGSERTIVVSSRPDKHAYLVERTPDGVRESRLEAKLLGA